MVTSSYRNPRRAAGRGWLAAGSVFPPEPEPCSLFGVSRTVIRESMRMMKEKGLARAVLDDLVAVRVAFR